uniref:Uncharacterized protein n=1 Tax=viral metagenome TaxID=1070528 RepID=A0A6M3K5K7_9ZZZZ
MYTDSGMLPEVEKAREIAYPISDPQERLKVFFKNVPQRLCLSSVDELDDKKIEAWLSIFNLNEKD